MPQPSFYREQARTLREQAGKGNTPDDVCRQLIEVAESYERLADSVERSGARRGLAASG